MISQCKFIANDLNIKMHWKLSKIGFIKYPKSLIHRNDYIFCDTTNTKAYIEFHC